MMALRPLSAVAMCAALQAGTALADPNDVPPAPPPPGDAPTAPPTPSPPPPVPPKPDTSALADDGHPLAGWHNGYFYIRDPHDNFRLYPQGSAQVDAYTYAGPGLSETALKPTLFLRRIRAEASGEILHRIFFNISGDFGATALDNPKGTNETSASAPGTSATASTARYASAQTAKLSAAPANVWVNVRANDVLNAQIGQYNAPFMLENRTSERYTAFMERSLAVRDVGIPTNKEIGLMLWGETHEKLFYYSAGYFDGAGQNRLGTDGRGDALARVFFHTLFM